jgi:hypothetical protein
MFAWQPFGHLLVGSRVRERQKPALGASDWCHTVRLDDATLRDRASVGGSRRAQVAGTRTRGLRCAPLVRERPHAVGMSYANGPLKNP